jgi:hypothetical protein
MVCCVILLICYWCSDLTLVRLPFHKGPRKGKMRKTLITSSL